MTGVYYMYVIKFVPSHLRDSSRTVVGHLRDLELGEGHEFKSHLELGFFGDFWCFISPFILSFLLAFLFQCVEKSSRSDCPICYEVRATLLFLDQIFCLGHTTVFKKVIIMVSPIFSPSKQKRLFPCAISLNSLFLPPVFAD